MWGMRLPLFRRANPKYRSSWKSWSGKSDSSQWKLPTVSKSVFPNILPRRVAHFLSVCKWFLICEAGFWSHLRKEPNPFSIHKCSRWTVSWTRSIEDGGPEYSTELGTWGLCFRVTLRRSEDMRSLCLWRRDGDLSGRQYVVDES